jgi:uncharacterized protein (TIGR02271 family)
MQQLFDIGGGAVETNQHQTVVGVFRDRSQAEQAVAELRQAGFRDDQIGIVTRDGDEKGSELQSDDKGSHVTEGAVTGLAAGAGVGTLWGLGIMAGLLPAIGPVIAGGTLAAILASAATGAAAAGLAGALIGLGIPEHEANYYEGEFNEGRILITVKADGQYDRAYAIITRHGGYDYRSASHAQSAGHTQASGRGRTEHSGAGDATIQAREEELRVQKERANVGEVNVRKEVHTEHRTIDVPVSKEEVVIERRPVHKDAGMNSEEHQQIRVPVSEERVHVEKHPVVTEEVRVRKDTDHDMQTVDDTVRKESIKVEKKGNANVREERREK